MHLYAVSGRVTSAFPKIRHDAAQGRRNSARGVLGSGAGRLRMNTTSGNISLLSRPVDEEEAYRDPDEAESGAVAGAESL